MVVYVLLVFHSNMFGDFVNTIHTFKTLEQCQVIAKEYEDNRGWFDKKIGSVLVYSCEEGKVKR